MKPAICDKLFQFFWVLLSPWCKNLPQNKIKIKIKIKSTGAKLVNLFCWPCLGGQGYIVF
jgi:hypothetical protein